VNPFLELREQLVGKPGAFIGKITAIDDSGAMVRGPAGIERATRTGALALSVGDEVFVKDGAIQGRVRASESVPVYRL
jgi:hypothetical protein